MGYSRRIDGAMNVFRVRVDSSLENLVLNDGKDRELVCQIVGTSVMEDGYTEIVLEVCDIYEV